MGTGNSVTSFSSLFNSTQYSGWVSAEAAYGMWTCMQGLDLESDSTKPRKGAEENRHRIHSCLPTVGLAHL